MEAVTAVTRVGTGIWERLLKARSLVGMFPKKGSSALIDQRKRPLGKVVLLCAWTFLCYAILPTASSSAGIVNEYCPVTTDELVDSTITLNYEGSTIAFCCNKCRRQFLADPQKYIVDSSMTMSDSSGSHRDTASSMLGQGSTSLADASSVTSIVTSDNHEHDHELDHSPSSSLVEYLGKFHPLVVHFPIALIITALLFAVIGIARDLAWANGLAAKVIYVAFASSVIAMPLGLAASTGTHYPADLITYLYWHRIAGISTTILAFASSIAARRFEKDTSPANLMIFRIILILSAVVVAIAGHLGAILIYGPGYFG